MLHRHTKKTGALMALLSGLLSLAGSVGPAVAKMCGGKKSEEKPAVTRSDKPGAPGEASAESSFSSTGPVVTQQLPPQPPQAPNASGPAAKEKATTLLDGAGQTQEMPPLAPPLRRVEVPAVIERRTGT